MSGSFLGDAFGGRGGSNTPGWPMSNILEGLEQLRTGRINEGRGPEAGQRADRHHRRRVPVPGLARSGRLLAAAGRRRGPHRSRRPHHPGRCWPH